MSIKTKVKLVVFLITFVALIPSSLIVFGTERTKKITKIAKDTAYYQSQPADYKAYLDEISAQIKKTKQSNLDQMKVAEANYADLLAKQLGLVASHSKVVVTQQPVATQVPVPSKPKTTTTTRTS